MNIFTTESNARWIGEALDLSLVTWRRLGSDEAVLMVEMRWKLWEEEDDGDGDDNGGEEEEALVMRGSEVEEEQSVRILRSEQRSIAQWRLLVMASALLSESSEFARFPVFSPFKIMDFFVKTNGLNLSSPLQCISRPIETSEFKIDSVN